MGGKGEGLGGAIGGVGTPGGGDGVVGCIQAGEPKRHNMMNSAPAPDLKNLAIGRLFCLSELCDKDVLMYEIYTCTHNLCLLVDRHSDSESKMDHRRKPASEGGN